ncbi:flippase [Aquibacillus sp. 3ASR75-11]|uniref:Flippase n=2 Tax=Terrihalobacillus insolitus TaxID=2950438 RepID=A0A9X4AMG7_9BACI|nr:flippase [Terrihalobacillus insolitus]
MFIGLFTTALIARYFGPEQFGLFNYALAFVTLFTAISSLGLETFVVKELVDKEYEEGTIVFSSFILRLISGSILTALTVGVINIIEPNDRILHLIVLILSLSMVFKAFEVIKFWMHRYQLGKTLTIVRIIVYVFFSLLKVFVVLFDGDLFHYALLFLIDAVIFGITLVIVYFNIRNSKSRLSFSFSFARNILSKSWYIILSGLMATLYMRVDQVMLGSMIENTRELGIYSAAVRVAEMWYFIPMAIITSFKPVIMEYKNLNNNKYHETLIKLYSVMLWVGIVVGVVIILFSKIIINILYGADFTKASSILTISVWAGTFGMLGTARSTWLISENLQKYNLAFMSVGMIINIILNLILIPKIGGYGAAIATLIAQIYVALIGALFFKTTRIATKMMLKAINPKRMLN